MSLSCVDDKDSGERVGLEGAEVKKLREFKGTYPGITLDPVQLRCNHQSGLAICRYILYSSPPSPNSRLIYPKFVNLTT